MKVSEMRWLFVGLLTVLFILGFVVSMEDESRTIGVSASLTNGHYRFAGGTDPRALVMAAAVIGLYLLLMNAVPAELGKPLPGLFRRYVAFWLDFILAMTGISPIVGLIPMTAEWRRTGVFEWTVERGSPAPGYWLMTTVSVLLVFVVLLFYYACPLMLRRPSPGACILKYQVISENGATLSLGNAAVRALVGFIAVASFPIALFIGRNQKKGQFWVDKIFSTQAVLSR
jgi:uncharacterized RDD family membrane protein YckC